MPPKCNPAKRVGLRRVPDPPKPKKAPAPSKPREAPTPKTELVKVLVPHRPQYSTECLDPEVQEWLAFDRLSSEQQTVAEIDSVDKKDNEQQDKRDDKGKLESSSLSVCFSAYFYLQRMSSSFCFPSYPVS